MQIQRLDYISEQKRWEAAKAREAPHLEDTLIEEQLDDLPPSMPEQEYGEADYILEQEEHELQELIASMDQESRETASQHYGSDDEDYDQLFMEYTSASQPQQQRDWEQERQQQHYDQRVNTFDEDAMDMS